MGVVGGIALGLSLGVISNATSAQNSAPSAAEVQYLRAESKPWHRLFGEGLLRVRSEYSDLVYDFEATTPSITTWLRFLAGQPVARLRVRSFSEVQRTYQRLEGRRLQLPARATARLVNALRQLSESSPAFRPDPLVETGTRHLASVLDRAMEGALSSQASLRAEGSPRSWALWQLRGSSARWLGELLIRPTSASYTQWDQAVFPLGLQHILDRGTIDGLPLVADRFSLGDDAPPEQSVPTVLYLLAPLILLGLVWPRLGALLGGAAVGVLGSSALVCDFALDWSYFEAWPTALLLPPTHLVLAALALSDSAWRSSEGLRRAYVGLTLVLGLAVLGGSLLGWRMASPAALVVGVGLDLCLLLGFLRRNRRSNPGTLPNIPPRAISQIERSAPYVGSGMRLR